MARKYNKKHPTYRKTSNKALKYGENLIDALQGNQKYFPALFTALSYKKIADFKSNNDLGLTKDQQITLKEKAMNTIMQNVSAADLLDLLHDEYGNRRPDNYLSTVDTIMKRYNIYEPKKIKIMMSNIITAREEGDDFYARFKANASKALLESKNILRSTGATLKNRQRVVIS